MSPRMPGDSERLLDERRVCPNCDKQAVCPTQFTPLSSGIQCVECGWDRVTFVTEV